MYKAVAVCQWMCISSRDVFVCILFCVSLEWKADCGWELCGRKHCCSITGFATDDNHSEHTATNFKFQCDIATHYITPGCSCLSEKTLSLCYAVWSSRILTIQSTTIKYKIIMKTININNYFYYSMNWLPSINFSVFCYCWGPVEVRSLHFYPSESNYILISLTFRPVRNAIFIASDVIPFDWLPSSLSSWGPEMKLLALLKRLSVIIFTLHKVES